jgi:hypothetical protein
MPVLTLLAIATSVGGIPSVVRSGRNGRLFSVDADVEEYVSYSRSMLSDWSAYVALAGNARIEFLKTPQLESDWSEDSQPFARHGQQPAGLAQIPHANLLQVRYAFITQGS